ncbi:hypothetical protein DW657_16350 [Prevotella sp. AM23-5]|uniref:hypothetical protein n=1 Tax=Segatella copri TaxID=165179 RepID=UPI000E4F70F3|nr:hypothetical protein [Segatella copri]RHN85990.1 hypothetical protein DW657_16350 [Prevotella sp. AM23-5]
MAEYNYLGKTGLTTLWNKCKSMFVKSSEKGKANGVATLDNNGNVPLSQLGNVDTSFAEVVTALPTTGIKKHIYMMKTGTTGDKNIYAEYIYTGDVAGTYDATKWEKLGEASTSVDLSGYVKTTTLTTELAKKVDKVTGKQLSTNDYTTAEKNKLAVLQRGLTTMFTLPVQLEPRQQVCIRLQLMPMVTLLLPLL